MNMQFADVKRRLAEQGEAGDDGSTARADGACYVSDCPCRGTVSGEVGRFLCTWHFGVPHSRHAEVTEALHRQRWLLDFIADLQQRQRASDKARRAMWVAEACRMWTDKVMHPTYEEIANPDWYIWRMREEVTFQCGNRPERVAPRVPQSKDPEWTGRKAVQQLGVNGTFTLIEPGMLQETDQQRQARVRQYAVEHGIALP